MLNFLRKVQYLVSARVKNAMSTALFERESVITEKRCWISFFEKSPRIIWAESIKKVSASDCSQAKIGTAIEWKQQVTLIKATILV